MIFAVLVYAFFICGLEVKPALTTLPLGAQSDFAQSFIAILLFYALLIILWLCAYPSYKLYSNIRATRTGYVLSHARFNSAIVVPWLIFSLVIDCTRLLPVSMRSMLGGNSLPEYAFMACMLAAMGVFFPFFLVRLWACKPIADGPVRQRLTQFCAKARFAYNDIMEWNLFEGTLITAGVMGIVPWLRYLLISPALLNLLDEQELEAVVAHEIGHVKRHHMLFYLLFVFGYSFFAYIFYSSILSFLLSHDFIFNIAITADGRAGPVVSLLGLLILLCFLLVYFRLLFGLFSRNFERQADGYACIYTGSGNGIMQSLEKIVFAASQSRSAPNWHHFSIQERIDYMRRCTLDASLVKKHDRKVSRLIAAYCAVLLLSAGALIFSGRSLAGGFDLSVIEKIAERRVAAEPDNPMLHFLLANIYYENEDYARAEKEYLAVIRLSPDNAEALNNLAWLYATARDVSMRNPEEALRLAQKAADLDPKPHVLDTLAESYFVNGNYRMALELSLQALKMNPPNRAYFEKQRKKFQEHLDADEGDQFDGDDQEDNDGPGVAI
jgi:Zn-dependent protease with chaperone function